MIPAERDTIVATATAPAGASRGVVRLSGPAVGDVLLALLTADPPRWRPGPWRYPQLSVGVQLHGRALRALCDLFYWPGEQSYTRQPAAELHTIGSPPLIEAIVRAACQAGARLASPGEFTLRAFLAGRIDLVQAEAVLGVIDAPSGPALQGALSQLAGGLSASLFALREELLHLLAELEAGLDFVDEEDIRFVEQDELANRLAAAGRQVQTLIEQTIERGDRTALPKVVLTGPPNVGKSSLFNALCSRWGVVDGATLPALVSDQQGTTRDSLSAQLSYQGCKLLLVDTAGRDGRHSAGIEAIAEGHSQRDSSAADFRLLCQAARGATSSQAGPHDATGDSICVRTKTDILPQYEPHAAEIATSSQTGQGLERLMDAIVSHLTGARLVGESQMLNSTAARCRQSLSQAQASLEQAHQIAATDQHDLVALELRAALEGLGEVTGQVVTDDILDRIFGQFCIGK